MFKANHDHFYYRKYSCMTCEPCRTFKTDPFTGSVKCEREAECGPWRKAYFVRKAPKKSKKRRKNWPWWNLHVKIRLKCLILTLIKHLILGFEGFFIFNAWSDKNSQSQSDCSHQIRSFFRRFSACMTFFLSLIF